MYVLGVTAMIEIQAGNGSSASVEGGSMKTALMSLMMTYYVHSVKFSSPLYNLFFVLIHFVFVKGGVSPRPRKKISGC